MLVSLPYSELAIRLVALFRDPMEDRKGKNYNELMREQIEQ